MIEDYEDIYSTSHVFKAHRAFMNKALIKVVTGQRRIGKSYMLLQVASDKYICGISCWRKIRKGCKRSLL